MAVDWKQVRSEIRQMAAEIKDREATKAPSSEILSGSVFSEELAPLLPLSLYRGEAPLPDFGTSVHYRQLACYEDRIFLRAAYLALLRHPPDPQGEEEYLRRLRSGMSKAEILVRLRYSSEGKTHGVRIRGLLVPSAIAFLEKIPFVSGCVRWLRAVAFLPQRLRQMELRQAILEEELSRTQKLLQDTINASILQINRLRNSARQAPKE